MKKIENNYQNNLIQTVNVIDDYFEKNIDLKNLPKYLDSIDFNYKGINFHVYGVLHAITGGTNQEYLNNVNQTILQSKGLKLCEKSMKKMYSGLDEELDDWIQMPFKDVLNLTFNLVKNPINWFIITKSILKEKFTKFDRFGKNNTLNIEDIGGSMAFHTILPSIRRELAGFPSPKNYLLQNLQRRFDNKKFNPPVFPDKDWNWLSIIEPYANIPCRSIHMIETAVDIANQKNINEISLFIGEIHNSDIQWYVNRTLNNDTTDYIEEKILQIIEITKKYNKSQKKFYILKKLEYFFASSIGAFLGFSFIISFILILKFLIHKL